MAVSIILFNMMKSEMLLLAQQLFKRSVDVLISLIASDLLQILSQN